MTNANDPNLTREIVHAIRDGDQSAFDALFERVGGKVYVYIVNRMGRHLRRVVEAEDILQEVYTQAFQSFHEFADQGAGSMARWMVGIARNQIRRLYKHHLAYENRCALREVSVHETRSSPGLLARADSGDPTPSMIVATDERNREIAAAVEALAPPERQVILLYVYEGLSLDKIGARTNTPRTTLSYRLARALEKVGGRIA